MFFACIVGVCTFTRGCLWVHVASLCITHFLLGVVRASLEVCRVHWRLDIVVSTCPAFGLSLGLPRSSLSVCSPTPLLCRSLTLLGFPITCCVPRGVADTCISTPSSPSKTNFDNSWPFYSKLKACSPFWPHALPFRTAEGQISHNWLPLPGGMNGNFYRWKTSLHLQ